VLLTHGRIHFCGTLALHRHGAVWLRHLWQHHRHHRAAKSAAVDFRRRCEQARRSANAWRRFDFATRQLRRLTRLGNALRLRNARGVAPLPPPPPPGSPGVALKYLRLLFCMVVATGVVLRHRTPSA